MTDFLIELSPEEATPFIASVMSAGRVDLGSCAPGADRARLGNLRTPLTEHEAIEQYLAGVKSQAPPKPIKPWGKP